MKIFSNTAITLDGKITSVLNDHIRLGTEHDLIEMNRIRALADAILVGGQTFRNLPIPLVSSLSAVKNKPMLNVILTRQNDVAFSEKYLADKRIQTLVLRHKSSMSCDLPVETHDFEETMQMADVVEFLKARGIQNLLIEGGGDLIFQFLKENLLDEMYVTVCPKILGGKTSTGLVAGEGFLAKSIRNLKLLNHHVIQNEIYLHYKVLKSKE